MQLLRNPLVQPLEEPFRAVLDDLARARRWPTSREPSRLGQLVGELSRAYNDSSAMRSPPPRTEDALAARLLFSFARDVPKGAGAVRELVSTGALSFSAGRALRVLDLGAGLGATTRGIARALAASGAEGVVQIDAIDSDASALGLAAAIVRARPEEGSVRIEMVTREGSVRSAVADGPYDLVVLGQVLSELDVGDEGVGRTAKHAALVERYAAPLDAAGAVVIVEPALRDRTRHLHAVRDLLLERGVGLNVFAPCVHNGMCPMLPKSESWCHEDLDVDLPDWLAPVARAAGLRWQGLTFSYLVLRRDGRRLVPAAVASAMRVVSSPVVTKGKRELFLCGEVTGPGDLAARTAPLRVMRLDRHRAPSNALWDEAARGDVLELTPPVLPERPRVSSETTVRRLT